MPRDYLPELFDLDVGDFADDLALYGNFARRAGPEPSRRGGGPVLELGAGTGRVAVPLARAGFEVWGIDRDEAMLARARCKGGPELSSRLRLVRADMADFALDRRFDLVFSGMGTFHHLLTPAEQLACLRCVERHLAPGGIFVCDLRPLFHNGNDWQPGESVPLIHEWTRTLPSTGETVIKLASIRSDPARQVQHETHVYDIASDSGEVRRFITQVDLRFTSRYEMEGLLREAGLELDQVYGSYELSPYDETSEYMITVARRAGDRP
jgi:SAM-dependent methyltransferase